MEGSTETCNETLAERDWVLGSREGTLGKLNSGHEEGWGGEIAIMASSLALSGPVKGRHRGEAPTKYYVTVSPNILALFALLLSLLCCG